MVVGLTGLGSTSTLMQVGIPEARARANAIALDAFGNVYVTSESPGSGYYDCATIKYAAE